MKPECNDCGEHTEDCSCAPDQPILCKYCGSQPQISKNYPGWWEILCLDCYDGAPDSETQGWLVCEKDRVKACKYWKELQYDIEEYKEEINLPKTCYEHTTRHHDTCPHCSYEAACDDYRKECREESRYGRY